MYVTIGCVLLIFFYIRISRKKIVKNTENIIAEKVSEAEIKIDANKGNENILTVFHNGKKLAIDYASAKNKVIMEFNSEGVVLKVVDGLFYDEVPAVLRKEDFIKGDNYVSKDINLETIDAQGEKETESEDEDFEESEDDDLYASIDPNILREKE